MGWVVLGNVPSMFFSVPKSRIQSPHTWCQENGNNISSGPERFLLMPDVIGLP